MLRSGKAYPERVMPLVKELHKSVHALIRAHHDDDWKGAGHPEDYDGIEYRLKHATEEFEKLLQQIDRELAKPVFRKPEEN